MNTFLRDRKEINFTNSDPGDRSIFPSRFVKFISLRSLRAFLVSGLAFGMTACSDIDPPNESRVAKAIVEPTQGNVVSGIVWFAETKDGVDVSADFYGLTPGKHGFHVHEFGDCSAPDASSAGEHFNPAGDKHGSPDSVSRHVGDLGNVEADETGYGHYHRVDTKVKLSGKNSVIGRSIIIHRDEDDFVTQPSGNSGPRIGCGIIKIVEKQ